MKRRTLLKAAGIGALATSAGVWGTRRSWIREVTLPILVQKLAPSSLSRALRHEKNRARLADDIDAFDDALKQAGRSKKPVLVIVIPEDEKLQYERADLISNFLNVGKSEDLALFTLAEVVCARMAWVRARYPKTPAGEPWFLVIDVHTDPVEFLAINRDPKPVTAELARELLQEYRPPAEPYDEKAWDEYRYRDRQLELEVFAQRTAQIGELLRQALTSDPNVIRWRGALVEEELPASLLRRLENAFDGGRLSDAQLERAAPLVYSRMHYRQKYQEGDGEHLIEDFARVAISKYRVQHVPGSRWTLSGSCGAEYAEDEDSVGASCGGAATPVHSRRFLTFYNRHYDE